ncbi:DegT/DnrJ/EryC1/StrS family aminotransferase [Bacillus paramycoides]|uniref:DegT/DnrJ/EryC1/StrS family aminotransferase n=1 Tax=Bacillus paramycoides TaxID=2026194 RepID=UPI002E220509|nr:DegT/DnrJ/EryC1/StrS family aminotransferase [Bacillus paramycoides]
MKEELRFIQPITVTQPKLPDFDLYTSYIKEVWNKKWLTNNGPLHEEFKEELKQYLRVPNLELFTNGHLALELGIKALGLTGEVITTPFTFASTIHAITNCGLKPVFCDIEMESFNIDVEEIEKHITEKTSAIVAVHVFGNPCNLEKISEIAEKYNLKIIYDAAHAFGVEINGRSIASYGDISMFSFHATKVFHSIEGGLLVFQDERLENKLKALKNFGMPSPDSVEFVGSNAKMNEFQAAMGLCNIKTIDSDIQKRKHIYEEYVRNLKNVDFIKYLPQMDMVKHNYSYFPIVLESNTLRDQLFEQLKSYNIYTRKYFYPLCNDFACYNYNKNETPNAVYVSDRILALPMFTELNINDIKQICEIILEESLLNV